MHNHEVPRWANWAADLIVRRPGCVALGCLASVLLSIVALIWTPVYVDTGVNALYARKTLISNRINVVNILGRVLPHEPIYPSAPPVPPSLAELVSSSDPSISDSGLTGNKRFELHVLAHALPHKSIPQNILDPSPLQAACRVKHSIMQSKLDLGICVPSTPEAEAAQALYQARVHAESLNNTTTAEDVDAQDRLHNLTEATNPNTTLPLAALSNITLPELTAILNAANETATNSSDFRNLLSAVNTSDFRNLLSTTNATAFTSILNSSNITLTPELLQAINATISNNDSLRLLAYSGDPSSEPAPPHDLNATIVETNGNPPPPHVCDEPFSILAFQPVLRSMGYSKVIDSLITFAGNATTQQLALVETVCSYAASDRAHALCDSPLPCAPAGCQNEATPKCLIGGYDPCELVTKLKPTASELHDLAQLPFTALDSEGCDHIDWDGLNRTLKAMNVLQQWALRDSTFEQLSLPVDALLDVGFPESGQSTVTRFVFGVYPEERVWQAEKLASKARTIVARATNSKVEFVWRQWHYFDVYANHAFLRDVAWAFGSLAFLLLYTWAQIGSFLLTVISVLGILSSFPLALAAYTLILGVEWIGVLHFLGIFIILGIGADDVFVVFEHWKHSKTEAPGSLERRLAWTLQHSVAGVTATTFTTMAAFAANMVSSITPVRLFGLFMFILVAVNYIFVLSLFPALLMLREQHSGGQRSEESARKFQNWRAKLWERVSRRGSKEHEDASDELTYMIPSHTSHMRRTSSDFLRLCASDPHVPKASTSPHTSYSPRTTATQQSPVDLDPGVDLDNSPVTNSFHDTSSIKPPHASNTLHSLPNHPDDDQDSAESTVSPCSEETQLLHTETKVEMTGLAHMAEDVSSQGVCGDERVVERSSLSGVEGTARYREGNQARWGSQRAISRQAVDSFMGTHLPRFTMDTRWAITLSTVLLLGFFLNQALQLSLPHSRPTVWKPGSNNNRYYDLEMNFVFGRQLLHIPIHLIWGLVPQDHGSLDQPYEYGSVYTDPTADFMSPESQLWLEDLCVELHRMSDNHVGIVSGSVKCPYDLLDTMLARQSLKLPVSKEVMQHQLQLYSMLTSHEGQYERIYYADSEIQENTFVYDSDSNTLAPSLDPVTYGLPSYQSTHPHESWEFGGSAGGQSHWPRGIASGTARDVEYGNFTEPVVFGIGFTLNATWIGQFDYVKGVWSHWEHWVNTKLSTAPAGLQNGFQTAEAWAVMEEEEVMYHSGRMGLMLSLGLACFTLVLVTGHLVVALVATTCITGVVIVFLGAMQLLGWTLGIIESVCVAVMVGLAVDYIVHMATAFAHCPLDSAYDRVAYSTRTVGMSVVSGAITTVGASLFLLPCEMAAFQQFGIIVCITLSVSLVFALFVFPAFCLVVMPCNRDVGQLSTLFHGRFAAFLGWGPTTAGCTSRGRPEEGMSNGRENDLDLEMSQISTAAS